MHVLLVAVGAAVALSAPAAADDMTPEEWESMRERFTKIAMRHENISHCTAIFADRFPQDLVREIEQITKSEGREAIADFCAAFVEDVARGNITYDDIYGNAE